MGRIMKIGDIYEYKKTHYKEGVVEKKIVECIDRYPVPPRGYWCYRLVDLVTGEYEEIFPYVIKEEEYLEDGYTHKWICVDKGNILYTP